MKDVIKKSLLMGLGAVVLTKESVEKFVKRVVKEGKISANQGKDLMKDLLKESDKAQKKVRGVVEKQVKDALKNMPIATKADLKALEKRLRKRKQG